MRTRSLLAMSMAMGGILLLAPQAVMAQGALDRLGDILDRVQQNRADRPSQPVPEPNTEPRPYIGAVLDTAVSDADQSGQGLLVTKVNAGGPAEKAGLQDGDRIVSINGLGFDSLEKLGTWLNDKRPGDQIQLGVVRRENTRANSLELTLTLGSREVDVPSRPGPPTPYDPLGVEEEMPLPADPLPPPQVDNAPRVLGVRVVPLTDQIRAQTGVSVRRGAYVESVSRGSVADRANIPAGSVIVAYDGRRVDDAVGLIQMVRNSPADRVVPVNYYYGNRLESTQVFFGQPQPETPQPGMSPGGDPSSGDDRPALRILQRAMDAIEGDGELPAGLAAQEQVDSLSRRVRDLEQEVQQLREELRALKSSGDL